MNAKKYFKKLLKYGLLLVGLGIIAISVTINFVNVEKAQVYDNSQQSQVQALIDKYWDNWTHTTGFKGKVYPVGEKSVPYEKDDLKKLKPEDTVWEKTIRKSRSYFNPQTLGKIAGQVEVKSRTSELLLTKYWFAFLPIIAGVLSIIASIPFGIIHLKEIKLRSTR